MARPQWLAFFDEVPEPRVERTRRHLLSDIIGIALIGAICHCQGWEDMQEFVEEGPAAVRELLELPHGVPSADTLRRVLGALDAKAFGACLIEWSRQLSVSSAGRLVSIDGKTVRGASSLHLVNAWVSDNSLVLGQLATDVKSNEITAIPELIKLLDIRDAVVSIDAMGCQKDIAKTICDAGGDYLFGLKKNHPTLHQEVLSAFDEGRCQALKALPESYFSESDKGHGRVEERRVWVESNVDWLARSDKWPRLSSLILVESTRTIGEKTSCERRAYISSHKGSAARFAALIRGHWHVENKLHWVLDVTFGEDRARVTHRNAAENLALLRKVALNLLKRAPVMGKMGSIAAKIRRAGRRTDYLVTVLTGGLDSNLSPSDSA